MAKDGLPLYNSGMSDRAWQVRVAHCGRVTCAPDWHWDTAPGLPDYDLLVIHAGRGHYAGPEGAFPVAAGSCLLLRKGVRYLGTMDRSAPMTVSYVHFDYVGKTGRVCNAPPALPAIYRELADPPVMYGLLARLLETARDFVPADSDTAASWLKVILLEMLRQDQSQRPTGSADARAAQIARLCSQIRNDPGARWRLPEMAEQIGCTPDHLLRLFRKFSRQSPGEFIIRTRIEAAMALLRSSSHTVTRIAELLGYTDVYAFSRQFHQKTGSTPTDFRGGAKHP